MPALNFQKRFAHLVESGEKRQTIRKRRKDGRDPTPGCRLYLFTGMRTKECRPLIVQRTVESLRRMAARFGVFGSAVECGAVFPIKIWRDVEGAKLPHLGPNDLYLDEEQLARSDGFSSWSEMLDWFEKTHGLPFKGLLIRW